MGRIVERMQALGGRRAALIVVIATVVAVGLYFGVRETGVSERTEAGAVVAQARAVAAAEQSDEEEMSGQGSGRASDGEEAGLEPLTLTLSAPLICEAHRPEIGGGYDGERWWYWESAGTMEVSWAAAGGDGAYTVTIVGETYTGASGSAEVSCALEHGPVSTRPEWGQIHAADDMPLVDSGPKTVSATVVDGSGATATASVDVYAVLNRGGFGSVTKRDRDGSILRDQDGSALRDSTLKGGKTYRIDGILMTVPVGVDLDVGTSEEYSPGPDDQDDRCCTIWAVWIVGSEAALHLYDTVYEEASRDVSAVDAIDANRIFDEFLASFGQPPRLPGGAEPLALTLSAPEICEASHPKGYRAHNLEWDEEEEVWRDVFFKWWSWPSVGTMEVGWAVNGGDAPYTVMIAGEAYNGASGTAEVSCALEHGPVFDHPLRADFERIHPFDDKPVVDSGIKTVMATVMDGSGATVEAAVDVYALLTPRSDDVLRAGETYRIQEGDDWLVTIPDGVEAECCGYVQTACVSVGSDGVRDESVVCENGIRIVINGPGYRAVLTLGEESISERGRTTRLHDPTAPDAAEVLLHARRALDDLVASVGQPPSFERDAR